MKFLVLRVELHWLTLLCIVLTMAFLLIEVYDVLRRPREHEQIWYMILLVLLLLFNLATGFLPDDSFFLPLKFQYMLGDGLAYIAGAYIPFYFYRVFGLDGLRWHALYGVVLFMLLPFLVFGIGVYGITGALWSGRQWAVVVPAAYGLVILALIPHLAFRRFKEDNDRDTLIGVLAVWLALLPWEVMASFAFFEAPQWLKALLANGGWMVITLLMILRAIKRGRREYDLFYDGGMYSAPTKLFLEHCGEEKLTASETEVILWVRQGLTNKEIADKLFRAEETVKKHLANMYKKTGTTNRSALIHLLEHGREAMPD